VRLLFIFPLYLLDSHSINLQLFMYMEILARKKSSASTTLPDIYRVSFLVVAVAVASAPFVLKPLFPSLQHFVAVTVSWLRDSFSRWLTPPYLFFLLNCIILAIFANSRGAHRPKFNLAPNHSHDEPQEPDHHRHFSQVKEIGVSRQDSAPEENEIIHCEEAEVIDSGSAIPLLEVEKRTNSSEAAAWKPDGGIASADDRSNKMLASARFTRRKVSVHESACKSLRVTQKHKEETFESVWKKITEGRHPPLTRHLRSTPNNPDGSRNDHSSPSARRRREEESSAPPRRGGRGAGSLKRETSVGVDDLNKRVEAFIEKFNADMRLQKKESLLHYMEMMNRGAS